MASMSTLKEKVKDYNIFDKIPMRYRSVAVILLTALNLVIINFFLPGAKSWYWVTGLDIATMLSFFAYFYLHLRKRENYALIATAFLFYISIILVASSALYAIFRFTAFAKEIDIEAYFRENEEQGMFIYLIINFVQPIFLPTPEAITTMAGSAIFGPGPAFVLGFLGTLSGILFMYTLVRFFGERIIRSVVKEKNLQKFNKYIRKQEILFLSIFFIFPVVSDEVVVLGSVLAGIRFRSFFIVATIAKLITQFIYSYSAASGILLGVSGTRLVVIQFILFFALVVWKILASVARTSRERHREETLK
ncbi:MAG TPA: VTT domain-containing protein [Clostridiaceae bacterium]|nr:VTT domain-containing protein [Clostridiaceae bacterium]